MPMEVVIRGNPMIHTPTGKIWTALALALLAGTGFCGESDEIWEQAAVEFHRAGSVTCINNGDWQEISTTDSAGF